MKITLRISRPSPTLTSAMATVPRPRKGRNSAKWAATPKRATAAIAPSGGDEQVLAEHDVDDEGGVGADRQEVAVREVGDALDAEDQRRADGGQGQDRAGDHPVDEQLGQPGAVGLRGEPRQDQHDAIASAASAPTTIHLLVSRELVGSAAIRTCASRGSVSRAG